MSNSQIEQVLTNIIAGLNHIRSADSATDNLFKHGHALLNSVTQLISLLADHPIEQLSQEFYEDITTIIEIISELRLSRILRNEMLQANIFPIFNTLTTTIHQVMQRHESFAGQLSWPAHTAIPTLDKSPKTLEHLQTKIEEAEKQAQYTSEVAIQANQQATEFLQRLQHEHSKNPGTISMEDLNQAEQLTRKMFVSNTVAALAADATAAAIVEMELFLHMQ